MDEYAAAPLPSDKVTRLWQLMQRIEYCRYRAELAEELAAQGSNAPRNEGAEIARHWRDLASEIERLDQLSDDPAWDTRRQLTQAQD